MSDLMNDLEAVDLELDRLLDAGMEPEYEDLRARRDNLVAELDKADKSGERKLAKIAKAEELKAVAGSASEQIKAVKSNIDLLRRQRDEIDPSVRQIMHGDAVGEQNRKVTERNDIAAQIAMAEEELASMERRLPFAKLTDDEAEETYLTVLSEAEKAKAELADLGDAAGFVGTRALLEKRIEAAESKARELAHDVAVRQQLAAREETIHQLAERHALKARRDALASWEGLLRESKARAETPGGMEQEYRVIIEAEKAIRDIKAMPEKPYKKELEPHLAELKASAPHLPGAWR